MVFSGFELGLVDISLHGMVENHIITKDVRTLFLDVDSYNQVQVLEKTCDTNVWDNIYSLKITYQFPVGVEVFIKQLDGDVYYLI